MTPAALGTRMQQRGMPAVWSSTRRLMRKDRSILWRAAKRLYKGPPGSFETMRGADGVGLYRTELQFMMASRFPRLSSQVRHYEAELCNRARKQCGGSLHRPCHRQPVEPEAAHAGQTVSIANGTQKEHSEIAGTGLGLYIIKNLINKMGGDIIATSKQGVGTTMSFSLPIAA